MNDAPQSPSPPGESQRIKAEIARFLREERLQPKLEELKPDDGEARQKLISKHQPATWIADAAHRVGQIQQVTHAIKFTHPSADGSSLSSLGNPAADTLELGTHSLVGESSADVVGNAAALDVVKFLRLSVDGRTLLHRATARDPALAEALSDDASQAAEWMTAFATLPEPKGGPSSHKLAKQLYWPLDDGGYHLLAPLFSSSLAQKVHDCIRSDQEVATIIRKSQYSSQPLLSRFSVYRDMAIQKLGGSNAQNVSSLNKRRGGENYLLASVPPIWKSDALRPPLKTDTVFLRYFGSKSEVRQLVTKLKEFLSSKADAANNVLIREKRATLATHLCGEALQMAAELRDFMEPGWSAQADCQLNLAEQCWLDPDRALSDEDFAARYRRGDWKDEVCLRFANWLNASLKTDKTSFGGPEAAEWQDILRQELEDE